MKHAVVILNWNGAHDTVECLRSIVGVDSDAFPIVVDNGSTDDSCDVIESALVNMGCHPRSGSASEISNSARTTKEAGAVLIRAGENLGFAAGCNVGLRVAEALNIDVTVFLNNDTIVEPGALAKLAARIRTDANWFAVLPLLMIHGSDRIWNCGGTVSRFGFRSYHHAGARRSTVKLPPELTCTFFTGCCFAVLTARFAERGGFSERFFFGEEDFELALWMSDRRLKALCLTDAVVHHKVSTSFSRGAGGIEASKVFVFYLNRFIQMKLRFGRLRWCLWLAAYLPYVVVLLAARRTIPLLQAPRYLFAIVRRAWTSERVTRGDFESILRGRAW